MQGSDFHVPGKNYTAQPGGQVGGGGGPVGNLGGRRPPIGNLQSIRPSTPLYTQINSNGQAVLGSTIQSSIQGTSLSTGQIIHSSSQEMGKQTHMQAQPPPQVYAQNPNRSTAQPNYYATQRHQQSRNVNHRNPQSGNQSQVVGMPGASNGQPNALYPHTSMAAQPPPVYVQSLQSAVQQNHQQNIYPMNNQMSMQFASLPRQQHQGQYTYPPYPAIFTAQNVYSYGHHPAHPHGFFYQATPNAQINIRGAANAVGNNNQHVSTSLNSAQATALVSQGSVQQQQQSQQTQPMHTINVPIAQTEVYQNFNTANTTTSTRSTKKLRTRAITDIVNPHTGRNICDEIYKDETAVQNQDTASKEIAPTTDGFAVVADFAARVAKLASESLAASPVTDVENPMNSPMTSNQFEQNVDPKDHSHFISESNDSKKNVSVIKEEKGTANTLSEGAVTEHKAQSIICDDSQELRETLVSKSIQNVLSVQNDPSNASQREMLVTSNKEDNISIDSEEIMPVNKEPVEPHIDNASTFVVEDKIKSTDHKASETTFSLPEELNTKKMHTAKELECKNVETDIQKDDPSPKPSDGKAMQKPKGKNKVKTKESNSKVIEKEESDMDIPVSEVQDTTSVIEIKVSQNVPSEDFDKEKNTGLTKDIKQKDNFESKREQDIEEFNNESVGESISNVSDVKEKSLLVEKEISQISSKETSYEETPSEITLNKDAENVGIHSNSIENEPLLSVVAQKNDENAKESEVLSTQKDIDTCLKTEQSILTTPTTATETTSTAATISATTIATTTAETSTITESTSASSLKYTYSDDQWSPINTTGKKVYDRDFLMKLQSDPNSKIKPTNLPDLDVVLKDAAKLRNPVDLKLKGISNIDRHDSLFPGFAKSSLNAKVPLPAKKSHPGKPKTNKPSMTYFSLSREEVKLRETENAWKPTRLVQTTTSEEQNKTDALYKRVRSVLNKLTPQKFDTLVKQVRELQIDTPERLQGVIDLVFEKAVDEPSFSVAYALMCKELQDMQVRNGDSKDTNSANFRKLILIRCQAEFEKNTVDEKARSEKLREIEEATDPEKKKELQLTLEDEERKMRIKSVGNIRFIGELFKQNMLTGKIMHECIQHLIKQHDEENLECLCKLLTTIGKVLESKNSDLSDYFKQMEKIANLKGKVSSRIRFMLQDAIDLRNSKWIPRRDDSNPKTIDQIQKEAESEQLNIQSNNASISTPRKDDRGNDRKRNRGTTGLNDDGWHPVSRTSKSYSFEAAKLKNKPPAMDDMQLGSKSTYQWGKINPKMTTPNKFSILSGSRSTGPKEYNRVDIKPNYDSRTSQNNNSQSNNNQLPAEGSRSQSLSVIPSKISTPNPISSSQLSDKEFQSLLKRFVEEFILGGDTVEESVKMFKESFPVSSHETFVHEIITAILENHRISEFHRNKTSELLMIFLTSKCLTLQHFKNGLGVIIEAAEDIIIDIPKLWKYFANILVHPVISNEFPLKEVKMTLSQFLSPNLRNDGQAAELIAELLSDIKKVKETSWIIETWTNNEIQWSDFSENSKKVDNLIAEHKLEFLKDNNLSTKSDIKNHFDVEKIHNKLLPLLKDSEFDDVCNWIQVNIGDKVKEPQFIRTLMTAILESSVEQCSNKCIFKTENFDKLQKLIQRYVDADDFLELQCLFAVQAYIHKLGHPAGLVVKIMNHLCENNVLSNEAFLAWEKNDDPAERLGKSVALLSLKSFFTLLKEGEDVSSGEEA